VFSPIVHGHPFVDHGLPRDWPFWERFNRDHLVRYGEEVVLMLDGWRESVGVAAEIRIGIWPKTPQIRPRWPTLRRRHNVEQTYDQ
jgi:hypothetical protein